MYVINEVLNTHRNTITKLEDSLSKGCQLYPYYIKCSFNWNFIMIILEHDQKTIKLIMMNKCIKIILININ